jgi:Flp pilus assembly protein TadG
MLFKGFRKCSAGNVTIMLALSAIPLLIAAGAAMDTVRVVNEQAMLQAATDAAAIAGGTDDKATDKQVEATVSAYLDRNGGLSGLNAIPQIAHGKTKDGHFFVSIHGTLATSFMVLAGIDNMEVNAYSEIIAGSQSAEVALVLDNTASMGTQGRLPALKSAAHNLINTLYKDKSNNAYLKVGIVPFAQYVNVGLGNRNAAWMDVAPDSGKMVHSCHLTYPNSTSSNCHDTSYSYVIDGIQQTGTRKVCDVNNGEGKEVCGDSWSGLTWKGCVGSRNSPNDENVPGLGPYPGILNASCPAVITDLTDDQSSLSSKIDAMVAVGETYIPQGLLWGWNLLDPSQPYTNAKTYAEVKASRGNKSIVLMTDGENTVAPKYPSHYSTQDPKLLSATNARMLRICDNIKATGISIYTVGFKVTSQQAKDVLSSCASNAQQAYDASDDAALYEAFAAIAGQLSEVAFVK